MKADPRVAPPFSGASALCRPVLPLLLLLPFSLPGQNASVEGRVLNALTGEPVRRVNLTLVRIHGKGDPPTAQTDDKGCFAFADLEPGGYRLRGERNGFLSQEYGSRLDPTAGTVLALGKGQPLKEVVFRLAPNATLAGRVLDDGGEALPNLAVTAYQFRYSGGKRQWSSSGNAQTNDRGEFRISGLRAGHYTIGAVNLNIGIGLIGVSSGAMPDKPEPAYAATYLGDASDISQAQTVDLKMGDDHRGVDIHLQKTPTVRVRGKVTGAPSGKILTVIALRKGGVSADSNPGGLAIVQPGDNTFEIRGLTPGSYRLELRAATEIFSAIAAPVMVEVADQHIDGIEIAAAEAAPWSGVVTLAGGHAEAVKGVGVSVSLLDYAMASDLRDNAAGDGQFAIKGAWPGKYRLEVSHLPDSTYLKSIRLGSREVDESALEWTGAPPKLEILLSQTAGQVEGAVNGPDGKPMAGAVVTLIPESGGASLYRRMTADHEGSFRMYGLAPGKYKLLAWEDLEPGAYMDPQFVKPFEGQAQSITVAENGKLKVTVQAIPFGKIVGSL